MYLKKEASKVNKIKTKKKTSVIVPNPVWVYQGQLSFNHHLGS